MKTFDEAYATADGGQAFSNGTDYEVWHATRCVGCVHDGDDTDDDDLGDVCPLQLVAMAGATPAEWTGPYGRYECSSFSIPPEETGSAASGTAGPGHLELVPRGVCEVCGEHTDTPPECRGCAVAEETRAKRMADW